MKSHEVLKCILIEKINKSEWWHVSPRGLHSYQKRGQFLASTFKDAEFYGRPMDISIKVQISNPVFGFSEREILQQLFPDKYQEFERLLRECEDTDFYAVRTYIDAEMAYKAQTSGHDSIVLVCESGRKSLENNHKPRSIELNILHPFKIQKPRQTVRNRSLCGSSSPTPSSSALLHP